MYRVLVADDEADERALIRFLLNNADEKFELYEAKNGKEALTIIQQKEIDILLSDIQMGHMTGIELAAKVREEYPDMEILFFSGYDDFEYVRSALSLRAVNYILKPVNPDELMKSLREIIARLDSKNLLYVKSKDYIEKHFRAENEIDKKKRELPFRYNDYKTMPSAEQEASMKKDYSEEDDLFMKDIETALSLKNTELLKEKVNALLDKYRNTNIHSHIYIRYICTMVLQQLMQQLPCQMKEFEEVAESIFMLRSFSDIADLIRDYLNQVVDNFDQEANSSHYVVYQVKQYIDQHYQEDLKLNQLAEQVFLSSNYLSNIFTKYTGCSLNKYIKQVRLKKAKEMLRNTNMKIADVGKEVGYANTSYFIKKFQEMYGITPEKYRLNPMEGKIQNQK